MLPFLLLFFLILPVTSLERAKEFQRYDAWFNNLANPQWGTAGNRLHRQTPSKFHDGVYQIDPTLPSAREISNLVFKGEPGIPSQRNLTTMFTFFSTVIASEIISSNAATCPLEVERIPVPQCDEIFDKECSGKMKIPYNRLKYDAKSGEGLNSPREHVNDRTSFIDASFVYGTSEPWVGYQRMWRGGRFLEGDQGYPPLNKPHMPMNNPAPPQVNMILNTERQYILGDPRSNENPGVLSFALMFFRYHNSQADRIKREHLDWSDEDVFQAARRFVIAIFQKIILYDFVPALLGDSAIIPPYNKYNPHVPPGVSYAFSTSAFRYLQSAMPPAMLLRRREDICLYRTDVQGFPALRVCQNWWDSQDALADFSLEEVILGMASQIAEQADVVVVEDWRDYMPGPLHFSRSDSVAATIMRGRDAGLPDYNAVRRSFGLPDRTWETINPSYYAQNPILFDELRRLYNNDINRLDTFVGGMLEAGNGEGPGELFRVVILDQFLRLRDSDRFWFENRLNGIFTEAEIQKIKNTTLRDIILSTTDIPAQMLQENVFFWQNGDPCPQPYQINSTGLEPCSGNQKHSYFLGNEATYIFTIIGLICIPLICLGVGYLLVQRRRALGWDSSFDSFQTNLTAKDLGGDTKKLRMPAFEWLEETHIRQVVVEFEPGNLLVKKPKGQLLRKVIFPRDCEVLITHSKPNASKMFGPYCLITLPKTHDLVLRLPSDRHLTLFLVHLKEAMLPINGSVCCIPEPNQMILDKAETKGRRQSRLDRFFREAYAHAFDAPELSDGTSTIDGDLLEETITRHELAQAMGMREDDLFIKRMFAVCKKDEGDDQELSFAEFLSALKKFSDGRPRDRYELLFTMMDVEGGGSITQKEFSDQIKSLSKVVGTRINDDQQTKLMEKVFKESGIKTDRFTIKRFVQLFPDQPLTMDIKGHRMTVGLDDDAKSEHSFSLPPTDPALLHIGFFSRVTAAIETYRQQIVLLFIFFLINIMLFLVRFWKFRFNSQDKDSTRAFGLGIAFARGSAEALMFCMAVIILTISRNVITLVREWPIGQLIPFDFAIHFHKTAAVTALFWALMHTIAHCVNFYNLTTQSQAALQCIFNGAIFGSNFLPTVSYWFYGTITGLTGILLVIVMAIIYVFAIPVIMRHARHAFRLAHLFIYPFYILTVLHGLPQLFATPRFLYYIIGPLIIFIIDRIMVMRQEYRDLQIIKAGILPSDIIYIQFQRPDAFHYRSGQWLRISSPTFSVQFNETHAFSIASAPQVPTMELYIKAVGPWTWKLRSEILRAQATGSPYPLINLHGPYGDGNQEWRSYDVAVLVGAGIGVTPYASTLTDLVLDVRSGRRHNVKCKKVYFVWVCPSHKSYEWFVDVLKEIEGEEGEPLLETHIFVTQFFHKYDLRTTMLYICEKHFRGATGGVSMFTGLRAQNHFGRPNFDAFFKFIQNRHSEVSDVGVFSCGPATINELIGVACARANRARNAPSLHHRFESF